jgi:hypothetical protein
MASPCTAAAPVIIAPCFPLGPDWRHQKCGSSRAGLTALWQASAAPEGTAGSLAPAWRVAGSVAGSRAGTGDAPPLPSQDATRTGICYNDWQQR